MVLLHSQRENESNIHEHFPHTGCPFHYYLKYSCGNYIWVDSPAVLYGSLCHYILEKEANCIKSGEPIDYDELEQYKNEKAYYNISIDRNKLKSILCVDGWYELIIPKEQLRIDSMLRLEYATDYAIMALKSYLDKFYKFERERCLLTRLTTLRATTK